MQSIYFFSLLELVIRLEFAWHLGRLHAFFSLSQITQDQVMLFGKYRISCAYINIGMKGEKNLKHLSQLLRTKAKLKKSRLRGRKK